MEADREDAWLYNNFLFSSNIIDVCIHLQITKKLQKISLTHLLIIFSNYSINAAAFIFWKSEILKQTLEKNNEPFC